ncbi:hypothetical protein BO78DRAFT_412593 [Aspergillus sclerotiicarbonarius CBS 121057]|uniref:Uncharacterized protein n=1 Tax=Aspergillus sclerotiicarbonarius (strain CBS 121057 / IBT 28362) TaxID=1448318 RepID=A0A319FP12_ASPSB|nr:hypothetical protein BO78DRAFT_412593 [Aspergillus sclerotiicarbonarius CBS 121057]
MFTFKNIFVLFALFGLFIQAGLATPLNTPAAVANVDNTVTDNDNAATAPVDTSNEAVDNLDCNNVSLPIIDDLDDALKPKSCIGMCDDARLCLCKQNGNARCPCVHPGLRCKCKVN